MTKDPACTAPATTWAAGDEGLILRLRRWLDRAVGGTEPIAHPFERGDQALYFIFRQLPEVLSMESIHGSIEGIDQPPTLPADVRRDEPSVLVVPEALDQTCGFHAIEQSGRVGDTCDHPFADLVSTEALFAGSPQDAKNVVLRGRNVVRLQRLRYSMFEHRRRPGDRQMRLLLRAGEWATLSNLVTKMSNHGDEDRCCHTRCQAACPDDGAGSGVAGQARRAYLEEVRDRRLRIRMNGRHRTQRCLLYPES